MLHSCNSSVNQYFLVRLLPLTVFIKNYPPSRLQCAHAAAAAPISARSLLAKDTFRGGEAAKVGEDGKTHCHNLFKKIAHRPVHLSKQ